MTRTTHTRTGTVEEDMVEDTVGGRAVLTETWTEAGIVTECTASTTTTDKTAETTSMAEQRISETRTEKGKTSLIFYESQII